MPIALALVSLITTTADAPSLSGQALPAVTDPSSRKTGLRPDTPSRVTPGRGQSSAATTLPSYRVTGVMSRAQKPDAMAASARCWLRTANSSCSRRVMPVCWATFSAVCPIAM